MANDKMLPKDELKKYLGGNETPEPHPDHASDSIQDKPKVDSIKDMASQVTEAPTEVAPSPSNLPGSEDLKTFNMDHDIPETKVAYKSKAANFNPKVAILASVALLVVGFIGFSLYRGDFYWVRDAFGLGMPRDPQAAIKKASDKTNALKSNKGSFNVDFSALLDEEEVKMGFSGETQTNNEAKSESVKMSLTQLIMPEELTKSYAPEYSKSIEDAKDLMQNVELKTFDGGKETYVYIPNVSQSWFKAEGSSFNNFYETLNPAILSDAGSSPLAAASAVYADGLTATATQDFTSYLKDLKREKDETVDGERTYHYKGQLDIDKILGYGDSGFVGDMYSQYLTTEINIWVAKKEMVITKADFMVGFKVDLSEFGGTGKFDLSLSFQSDINSYNQAVEIQKPADAKELDDKTLEEMLMGTYKDDTKTSDIAARNAKRKADIAQIKVALEQYYVDNSKYPEGSSKSTEDDFLKELADKYLASVPKDPSGSKYYYNYSSEDGTSYTLNYIEEKEEGYEVKTEKSN